MSRLDPNRLSVEYRSGVTDTEPIIPRRYTLTHSDIGAELFLTIGFSYAFDKINELRDEVLGEWYEKGDGYIYQAYVYVNGELESDETQIRNRIFREELPLALEAIRYGDRLLFQSFPELDKAPIIIYFLSSDPKQNQVEYWGTFSDYIYGLEDVDS